MARMARPFALAAAVGALFLFAPAASSALLLSTHQSSQCKPAGSASFHEGGCTGTGERPQHHPASHHLLFVAHDGRCPDANLAPSPRNVELVRAATLCLVNRERARHGEAPLRWNDHLIRSAQSHTHSMAFGDYFAHSGPGGQTPLSRMRRTGYISRRGASYEVGENIAWGSLWLGTPKAIVAGWMRSPGHRANILDRRFRDTGIGVCSHLGRLAHGQRGGIYTQDFGVITG
jgi:uncharacterized protein YkwD